MINFITTHPNAIYPTRGSNFSVGYDLYCHSDIILNAESTTKIPLGISLQLPNHDLWAQIMDRSSMGMNGLHVFGGVIDPDYTGEICVLIHNTNKFDVEIQAKNRVAQMVFHPTFIDINGELPIRGDDGFGSTGK